MSSVLKLKIASISLVSHHLKEENPYHDSKAYAKQIQLHCL